MSNNEYSGYLAEINIFPVKSCAAVSLPFAKLDDYGLQHDRRFVVVDENGKFITGRTAPKLALIQAQQQGKNWLLTAPNMPQLQLAPAEFAKDYQNITVWQDTIQAQVCSTQADNWFSQYLGKTVYVRYFGENSSRFVKNRSQQVGFADGYPLLLISRASLLALNQQCPKSISMAQFRTNLVVDACQPFAEDSWRKIRIGEVEFDVAKPCSRCVFTTVNPQTAEKDADYEPLTTLKRFRQYQGEVLFGQNLVALNKGKIYLNDKITVLERQNPVI